MKHYVDINTLPPFIYIHNTNKLITKNYDTQTENNPAMILNENYVEKEYVSVPVHQLYIPKEIESQRRGSK